MWKNTHDPYHVAINGHHQFEKYKFQNVKKNPNITHVYGPMFKIPVTNESYRIVWYYYIFQNVSMTSSNYWKFVDGFEQSTL